MSVKLKLKLGTKALLGATLIIVLNTALVAGRRLLVAVLGLQ